MEARNVQAEAFDYAFTRTLAPVRVMTSNAQPRTDLVTRLLGAVHCARLEHAPIVIPLTTLPAAERAELELVIGPGTRIASVKANFLAEIHDTNIPGVWRTRVFGRSGRLLEEDLEVGETPRLVRDAGQAMPPEPPLTAHSPKVAAAVRHILACVSSWRPGDPTLVLPIKGSQAEREELAKVLGVGPVAAESHHLGHSHQQLTHLRRVWWLRYFSARHEVVVETLEVGDAPSELRVLDPELGATEELLADLARASP